jgi:alkanesulfonate monooxygenase SsuD/methylene tetrahydromethanopterin reductase-like flavin-dependent oxidoreductase (luciferase family)
MHIGVFSFATDTTADPAILAKRAEELGFASFWVPEHGLSRSTTLRAIRPLKMA